MFEPLNAVYQLLADTKNLQKQRLYLNPLVLASSVARNLYHTHEFATVLR